MNFEILILKNRLTMYSKNRDLLKDASRYIKSEGKIVICQVLPSESTRLSHLITDTENKEILEEIEEIIFSNPENPLTNWSKDDLIKSIEELGFKNITTTTLVLEERRVIKKDNIDSWFGGEFGLALDKLGKDSLKENLVIRLKENIAEKEIKWISRHLILKAVK